MFGWAKKQILKLLLKDIIKKYPKYKDFAFGFIEQKVEELWEKVTGIIEQEIAKALNK